jgi:hypothetical protein
MVVNPTHHSPSPLYFVVQNEKEIRFLNDIHRLSITRKNDVGIKQKVTTEYNMTKHPIQKQNHRRFASTPPTAPKSSVRSVQFAPSVVTAIHIIPRAASDDDLSTQEIERLTYLEIRGGKKERRSSSVCIIAEEEDLDFL